MLTCVLNAAEGQLNIVLGNEAEIVCAQSWPTSPKGLIKGAEILTPALYNLFSLVKSDVTKVERWACVHGPGSFTGIRMVLGTVAAIRRISNAKNASIDFMQALALDAILTLQNINKKIPDQVWVITHARSNMVHYQTFSVGGELIPQPIMQAKLSLIDDIIKDMSQASANFVILGSGLERHAEVLNAAMPSNAKPIQHKSPSYHSLWQLALQANYHAHDIEPLYIRPCDAVENLDAIARKQGLDPSEAHARLALLLRQDVSM